MFKLGHEPMEIRVGASYFGAAVKNTGPQVFRRLFGLGKKERWNKIESTKKKLESFADFFVFYTFLCWGV